MAARRLIWLLSLISIFALVALGPKPASGRWCLEIMVGGTNCPCDCDHIAEIQSKGYTHKCEKEDLAAIRENCPQEMAGNDEKKQEMAGNDEKKEDRKFDEKKFDVLNCLTTDQAWVSGIGQAGAPGMIGAAVNPPLKALCKKKIFCLPPGPPIFVPQYLPKERKKLEEMYDVFQEHGVDMCTLVPSMKKAAEYLINSARGNEGRPAMRAAECMKRVCQ